MFMARDAEILRAKQKVWTQSVGINPIVIFSSEKRRGKGCC
jgi:hypothetical protein